MYVDAVYDRFKDEIQVVERFNGERVFTTLDPEHVFYAANPGGSYTSIFGDPLRRYVFSDTKKFKDKLKKVAFPERGPKPRIFESDINPIFRVLAKHYTGAETPTLQVAYFDIEVEFDPTRGFAPVTDTFNKINAISVYCGWLSKLICLVLRPPTMTTDEAQKVVDQFEDTILFDDEKELLRAFVAIVEDADILTGWNSEGFDIPYIVNRMKRLFGEDETRKLCLWNQLPREREYEKFKKKHKTYDLVGRVHLDYLLLYQKHNTQQLHSYRLDYVGEIEVGENKVPYDGTLDQLWKQDLDKFIEYSRQDTFLLYKIDKKKKFIELANQIAHANCVLLKTTMGSVALVEQAIINEFHSMGFIAPDRRRTEYDRENGPGSYDRMRAGIVQIYDENGDPVEIEEGDESGRTPVVGAYVANPRIGLRSHVGCTDINSLYPSAIRALNMSPETIRGQCRSDETMALVAERIANGTPRAEAWEGLFHSLEYGHILGEDDTEVTVDWEDGRSETKTGAEWYAYLFNPLSYLCITANGTIFSTKKDGMIPALLARWYADRKIMQGLAKWYGAVAKGLPVRTGETWDGAVKDGLKVADGFVTDLAAILSCEGLTPAIEKASIKSLQAAIDSGCVETTAALMQAANLVLVDDVILARDVPEAKFLSALNDQRQLAKKILLNSLYGALLNEGLRFYDERLGQSVTLTGRSIVRHMNAKINEVVTGHYDYKGDGIVYADTDSCYFSAYEALKDNPEYANFDWSRENVIALYDAISDETNESFPAFMARSFNTTLERGGIIAAGRELVGSEGLFIKKKKYAILMYDKEGERLDVKGKPGKLKVMGLDLKRADTPKKMQQFLEKVLLDVLTNVDRKKIYEDIKQFRRDFVSSPSWEKGTPKGVKALLDYQDRDRKASDAATNFKGKDLSRGKKEKGKIDMPGHVRASLNWNAMLDMVGDRYSMRIGDGAKVIVCKLKPNVHKMDSIAYPIDEPHLPAWFKELPFDDDLMESTIIDAKLTNLVGVLNWDLNETKEIPGEDFFVF